MQDVWIDVLKDYSLFIIGGFFAFLFYLYKKNESSKEQKVVEAGIDASEDLEKLRKDIEKKLDSIMLTVEKTHEFVIRQDEKNKIVMERIEELYTEVSQLWKHHNTLKTKFENLLVEHKHTHNIKSDL